MKRESDVAEATDKTSAYSRRNFLTVTASSAAVPLVARSLRAEHASPKPPARAADEPASFTLKVNGRDHRLAVDIRTTLLDAVREHLGLTGAKKGCDHGNAGPARCWSTAGACCPASHWRSRSRPRRDHDRRTGPAW